MKFYYENIKNNVILPNGNDDQFMLSEFDEMYGLKNPIFELSNYSDIIICLKSNQSPLDENFYYTNETYFNNLFSKIENKPNIRIVLTNTHEGADIYYFLKKIVDLKIKYKLKKSQIIIVSLNAIIEKFIDDISCIYEPYLLFDLSKNYNLLEKKEIVHNNQLIKLCTTEDYLNVKKDKFFLSYNKNCLRLHRTKFILWLIKTGIINDTLYSLLIKKPKDEQSISNFLSDPEFKELVGIWQYYDDYESLGYNILDWNYLENKNDVYSNTTYTSYEHYASTIFNIITETTHDKFSLNLTEKSFKAFANCHPFLIIGDLRINEKLKAFGFKLYDNLIDYSFDSIYDDTERLNGALEEIKRIYNLGEEYIINWYKNNIETIEYNKDIFLSYSKSNMLKKTLNNLKMKKILITGCNGLVGIHLVKKCIENGYDVVGVDKTNPSAHLSDLNFKYYNLDLTIEENIKNVFEFEKPDVVFNCFGIKGSPLKAKTQPVDFLYPSFKINTEIINQCAKNNIYLCFVSSVGVYAPAEKFVEDSVWKTLPSEADWFPSWSKRMGEILLESYKVQYGYNNWSIIRPANIFGEYDDFGGNGTVIATQCKKISEAANQIDAWGDGTPIRDFVYAGDVADAILDLYERDLHTTINFGAGEEITIKSMIEELIKISGKDISINWDTSKPNGDMRRQMDTTKQIELNLLPKLGFKEALEITYNHYLNNK
jgi:GDP-L-fucose synthase